VDFAGDYYQIQEGVLLPRPQRAGGPPILIGGNGPKRTLPLVARYAQEWNGVYITPEQFAEKNQRLDTLLVENGRFPQEVRRSMMVGCIFGNDTVEVDEKLRDRNWSVEDFQQWGAVVGTGSEMVDQLGQFAEAGVQRIMLQWLDMDDIDRLEAMAHAILPQMN
jgi:alkanesulfonate monooxygenase SsuD/methylene tetrahydromethanopterin reductase-like flavin-dependent oxidoreductase (luciferase family)